VASLMRIAEPLGLRGLLYVDPELVRRMKPLWTKRDGKRVHTKRQLTLGKATIRRVLRTIASEMGKRGGLARMRKLTPEQRREIGRRGAAIRWARRAEASSR